MQNSIQYIRDSLHLQYSESELRIITQILISKITGYTSAQTIVNKNTIFSDEQVNLLHTFVEKLKKSEPLQYVTGETEFYGLKIKLNNDVLIPRPETEELIEWMLESLDKNKAYNILDIGTGSGCIALALKSLFPNAQVNATDMSTKALEIAKENARALKLEIVLSQKNALTMIPEHSRWDVIVSNPPYIPLVEKASMDSVVVDFEPHEALFVPDNDPLVFYRKIAEYALGSLTDNGFLFFEIHRNFGNACKEMLQNIGFRMVELHSDISGNDRMIKAQIKIRHED